MRIKELIHSISDDFYKKVKPIFDFNKQTVETETFFEFLFSKFPIETIIKTEKLSEIIKYVETNYDRKVFYYNRKESELAKNILEVFGYSRFRQNKATWFAEKLNIKTCMYCNTQYATVIQKDENNRQVLFQFDHFYPKSLFPYLSMSIFNLVPICANCNQSKSNKFYLTIENPYIINFDEFSRFELDKKETIQYLMNPTNNIAGTLKLTAKTEDDETLLNEYDKEFNISEKHKVHSDYIQELAWKSKVYTDEYKTQLKELLRNEHLSDEDIERFIIGNYSKEEDVFKRPLSKLTRDIAEELGLI